MMRNSDAVIEPAFYDHEHENVRDRERRADDWGADALFSGNPRRRFDRRPSHGFERRASGPVTTARPEFDAPRHEDRHAEAVPASEPRFEELTDGVKWSAPAPEGRRTVVVTGRPGATSPAARRRPPRTAQEHLGGRPDRIAGWAFGLGLLLIGIAAAPL